jgi:hypothetical protein
MSSDQETKQQEMEEWKDIPDIPYQASSLGNIRNKQTNYVLSQSEHSGYLSVCLYINKAKKTSLVHRLVASAFLEQKEDVTVVKHKNHNQTDNRAENLMYVTWSDVATLACQTNKKTTRKIKAYKAKNKSFIAEYDSCMAAAKALGISDKKIGTVARGNKPQVQGYIFIYSNKEFTATNVNDVKGVEIEGFENYLITCDGKVFSKKRKDFLVPTKTRNNSAKVALCNNGIKKDAYIHILVKQYFGEQQDEKEQQNQ